MVERARPGEGWSSAALVFGVAAALGALFGAVDAYALELRFLAVPAAVGAALGLLAVVSGIVALARRTPDRVKVFVAVGLGVLGGGVAWAAMVRAADRL
jgi:drug/metabolite transporter (DMT)-like permease